ncbi:hypothetical protein NC652_008766 [Populus alba x Populus x berolinensis]|nr:hypothetical protein NC652_008766 [Populus alba x Populus x berolinensis]
MDLPTLMDYKMGHIADIARTQDFHDGIQSPAFVIFFSVLMVYKLRRNLNTITRLQLRTPRQKRTAGTSMLAEKPKLMGDLVFAGDLLSLSF